MTKEERREYNKNYREIHRAHIKGLRRKWFEEQRYKQGIDEIEPSFKSVDINNRNELQELAEFEQIYINWPLWDRLVQETKEDIDRLMQKEDAYSNGKKRKKVLVFSIDEKRVIEVYDSPSECAEHYGIMRETITNYAREMKPYKKLGLQFIII